MHFFVEHFVLGNCQIVQNAFKINQSVLIFEVLYFLPEMHKEYPFTNHITKLIFLFVSS